MGVGCGVMSSRFKRSFPPELGGTLEEVGRALVLGVVKVSPPRRSRRVFSVLGCWEGENGHFRAKITK